MASGDDSDDVLSRLPRTRPARRSTHRAAASDGAGGEADAKPRPAAKPKAAAKPRATAKPKASTKPRATAAAEPRPTAAEQQSGPAGREPVEPAPDAVRGPIEPPSATEIVQSAVQAASDLAHVGLAIGREALRAARSKLPRP